MSWSTIKRSPKRRSNKTIEASVQKENSIPHQLVEELQNDQLGENLDKTLESLKNLLGKNVDYFCRQFQMYGKFRAAIVYFSSIVDTDVINNEIMKPFMYVPIHTELEKLTKQNVVEFIINEAMFHNDTTIESDLAKIISALLGGEAIILIDGVGSGIQFTVKKIEKRSITQPETEQVILGPREGYIESLQTNVSLLRNRLKTADFRVETMEIGRISKSTTAICYLEGIATTELVEEVKNRLGKIDIDAILDAGYIEQFIEDNHMSPFPQIQSTERPDKTVGNILEGRVAILVDGSPFALIVPVVFNQFYQTLEDYSSRFLMGSFVRLARMVALVFSLIFPSLYVSFISFNPELLPTEFAVAVAGGRAGVPFPAVIEVLVMEVAMEILREATVRLPKQVGGALSIVGVLVIGQAAVEAGIASPITVVVIAMTTIGSFATPAYDAAFALRMLRFPIVIMAVFFGLYGVVIGVIFIVNHMLSLKSFGVPYMSPVTPGNFQGLKDVVIRSPFWWMPKRPAMFHPQNSDRLGKVKEVTKAPKNTLDPVKVGNEKWEEERPSGVSKRDNSDSSNDNFN
ncbi:spore germination protein [Bacillus sp. REN16]|uniref:spore germination protein n=1 Tax=Bacillus sp. REN16 TaxID=2887296 RepID=UPI001E517438|nr:spore germination protein [Bacillus sp. REN16]MCC3355822.1 spore germination protein [Bacillus sp. REN16]